MGRSLVVRRCFVFACSLNSGFWAVELQKELSHCRTIFCINLKSCLALPCPLVGNSEFFWDRLFCFFGVLRPIHTVSTYLHESICTLPLRDKEICVALPSERNGIFSNATTTSPP